MVFTRRIHFPLTDKQLTTIFWGVWVASGVVVFSVASTPPLLHGNRWASHSALVGNVECLVLGKIPKEYLEKVAFTLALALFAIVQVVILSYTPSYFYLLTPIIVSGSVVAVLFL